jgi:hypothetical protein
MVIKLYKEPTRLAEYDRKINSMLAEPPILPPVSTNGRQYIQLAWPIAKITDGNNKFRGFAMPKVELQESTALENILQKSSRRKLNLPESYRARVLLAANLASLVSVIHEKNHYLVDMKPLNMRFYPAISYIALIDTDGFSISGPPRIPAQHCSDDYTCPEAKNRTAAELGLQQDLFALAVIIFQLLNNGIHPFSGIDSTNSTFPTSRQERIFAGLYVYGFAGHASAAPAFGSIHDFLEGDTRRLFDRAFLPGQSRPTSREWATHLRQLIVDKRLVTCVQNPREHEHFSAGCGLCDLGRRLALRGAAPPPPQATQIGGSFPTNRLVWSRLSTPTKRWLGLAVVFIIAVIVLASRSKEPPTAISQRPFAPVENPAQPARPGSLSLPRHIQVGANGRLFPEDGYVWISPNTPEDLRTMWQSRKRSQRVAHIMTSESEGEWQPEDGYDWTNPIAQGDKRVKWVPGTLSRKWPHITASDNEGEWRPEDGYEWTNPSVGEDTGIKCDTWNPLL